MSTETTSCPYCSHNFGKVLSRGRNCPACNGAVKMRKPYPHTNIDAHIPRVAMTVAQADAESEKWKQDALAKNIATYGYDVGDRELRHEKFRQNNQRNLERARKHPDVIAVEVKASPNPGCTHACIGLWDINDYPVVPPKDCPNEACLCFPQPVFRDELRGRSIAGWRTYDQ